MDLQKVMELDQTHYMNTFGKRIPLMFTHGTGCKLYDQNGKEYTDFLAGIATNALGYAHEGFTKVICEQAQKILHCSNYFYIEQQAQLAAMLCEYSCADRVFFASTGAEANECAIKLARKYFYGQNIDRYEIISTNQSFHGRTIATLAATGQEKYRIPYAPLPGGFLNVEYGSLDAIKKAITDHTAAVMVEPIQGESGVIESGDDYLPDLRALCDQHGILLILDEVQTGMGRTGKLFAHEHADITPDIFTTAKALGNGIPISACLCKESVNAFLPGEHGTTFGGNPFCCTAGLYVMQTLTQPGFLDSVTEKGIYFKQKLQELKTKHNDIIVDVRGKGLILGVELHPSLNVAEVKNAMIEKGFIIGTAGHNTLRLVPPLIIEIADIGRLIPVLDQFLSSR